MALYLVQAAYTSSSWKTQVQNPQNYQERIEPLVQELGGQIVGAYYAFGDYDVVALIEMADQESAAAFSLAISAGGSVSAIKTTPLISIEQGIEAMKKAAGAGGRYTPPSE